jgi:hypothetical protein
MEINS